MITDSFIGCVIMVGMAVGCFLSAMLFVYILYKFWKEFEDEKDHKS